MAVSLKSPKSRKNPGLYHIGVVSKYLMSKPLTNPASKNEVVRLKGAVVTTLLRTSFALAAPVVVFESRVSQGVLVPAIV